MIRGVMPGPVISQPFRLDASGHVVTVAQGSAAGNAEEIAVLCSTVIGERPLAPGYGVTDPAFRGLVAGQIAAQVAAYGPRVSIRGVQSVPVSPVETDVTVLFS